MKNNGSKFVGCLMLFSGHIAAMPYTFTAGDPAIADEVNTNFIYLEDKLAAIDHCRPPLDGTPFTYTKKNASPGTQFVIGSNTYFLIRIAFIDPVSSKTYDMTFPVNDPSWATPTFKIIDPTGFCSNNTIDGYPSDNNRLEVVFSMEYITNANIVNSSKVRMLKVFEILVGNVLVSFKFEAASQIQNTGISSTDRDYTQAYDLRLMVMPAGMIQQVDDLFDYITITERP